MHAEAMPILPSSDLDRTLAFYGALGFEIVFEQTEPAAYAIVGFRGAELHFFAHTELEPERSIAGAYLRVDDADRIHRHWRGLGLPEAGVPRLGAIGDREWGMREFALVDPDGNLVRVGHLSE